MCRSTTSASSHVRAEIARPSSLSQPDASISSSNAPSVSAGSITPSLTTTGGAHTGARTVDGGRGGGWASSLPSPKPRSDAGVNPPVHPPAARSPCDPTSTSSPPCVLPPPPSPPPPPLLPRPPPMPPTRRRRQACWRCGGHVVRQISTGWVRAHAAGRSFDTRCNVDGIRCYARSRVALKCSAASARRLPQHARTIGPLEATPRPRRREAPPVIPCSWRSHWWPSV
mmetsp:Transcript_28708/g.73616  ORF Transcript_28708/g.73616 Transcript_28708/m.73616 type:complete len:227 (-) Transcript_28708:916-1596(-)